MSTTDSIPQNEPSTVETRSFGALLASVKQGAGLFWALIFACTIPFLLPYIYAAWNQEHFQYIPLVLVLIGVLAFQRHRGVVDFPRGIVAWSLFGIGVIVMAIAGYLASSWVGGLAIVFLLLSFLSSLRQDQGGTLLYLGIPLLMFIRLPRLYTDKVIVNLQVFTTDFSSVVLDVFGVPHHVQGNTIDLASKHLFVNEACSGVRSLFTLCFCALAMQVIRRRSVFLMPIMFFVGVLLAIFGNTLRVCIIALAEHFAAWNLAVGWQHEVLGYFTLFLSLALLYSADRLVGTIFHKIDYDSTTNDNPFILVWNFLVGEHQSQDEERNVSGEISLPNRNLSRVSWGFTAVFAVFALMMIIGKIQRGFPGGVSLTNENLLFAPNSELLSEQQLGVEVSNYRVLRQGETNATEDDRLGMNSDVWKCSVNNREGELVVSQPYVGWHELPYCYISIGWEKISRREVPVKDADAVVLATFKRPNTSIWGYLFFTGVNADGSTPQPYGYSVLTRYAAPFVPAIKDDPAEIRGVGQTAMIQYFHVTDKPLSDDDIKTMSNLVSSARERVKDSLLGDF